MRAAIFKPKGTDLKSISDFNSDWADRIALLILAGLGVDIVTVFVPDKALSILANVLIIGGVWGELRFAKRARNADDERVAEANKLAATAQADLVRFRTPRRDVLRGHENEIIEKLKSFDGTPFDTGAGLGDGEQSDILWDIVPVLEKSGWNHVTWSGPGPLISQGPTRAMSGQVSAKDFEIHLHDEFRSALAPAAAALIEALNEIGIVAADAGFNSHSRNINVIHIQIGPRQ